MYLFYILCIISYIITEKPKYIALSHYNLIIAYFDTLYKCNTQANPVINVLRPNLMNV